MKTEVREAVVQLVVQIEEGNDPNRIARRILDTALSKVEDDERKDVGLMSHHVWKTEPAAPEGWHSGAEQLTPGVDGWYIVAVKCEGEIQVHKAWIDPGESSRWLLGTEGGRCRNLTPVEQVIGWRELPRWEVDSEE